MHESKQELLVLSALLFFQIKTHWVKTQLPADLFSELTQKDRFCLREIGLNRKWDKRVIGG